MRQEFLSFSPPYLSDAEINAVVEVLKSGAWLSSGPKVRVFEANFQAFCGAEAALALNSCTAGLHLAMCLHDIGPGDEVITSPMTFSATANVVEHVGGTVVLADIDPDTLLIDPAQIKRVITSKTKVILPVHYAGHPCDMPTINEMARAAKCAVVEDAAHCLPSTIGGQPVGAGQNLATFSFYATKNMTTGEGGMLTGPKELIDPARTLALHGMSRHAWDRFAKGGSWKYDVVQPGYKYNLTDIAAAMGIVQLKRLDELFSRRMRIVDIYERAFSQNKYLRPLKTLPGFGSSRHLYVIQLNPERLTIDRDQFIVGLTERNIGSSVHYRPIHMLSYYAKKYGWSPASFPNATRAFDYMLSIPLSSKMEPSDAEYVVAAIEDITTKFTR